MLIVRPSALGDVCRTVPVLASLRAALPEAVIDWVVRDRYQAAIAAHPALDEAIPFPRDRFARWWSPSVARELKRWAGALRRRKYDVVLDCQGLGRSGLITRATGAPRRIGPAVARELAWVAYTDRCPIAPDTHTVDAMLALLAPLDIEPRRDARLYLVEADEDWWTNERRDRGFAGVRYAVLAPTARWQSKQWPIERWRTLAAHLLDGRFDRLVLIGAPGESDQVRPLAGDERIVDLVGGTTVGQSMAVIAGATLVVATDSAPLHIAVGFDRPCVGLYGPTDPARVGPFDRPDAAIRRVDPGGAGRYRARRLDDAAMRRISVDDVIERIEAVSGAVVDGVVL
ncbi:MAG: glycosyltransferase family 9 protein [Phycisphaerales bacterium]|nr:glycosyltransferase family 9 protein [Phycisphaerales bacterium]